MRFVRQALRIGVAVALVLGPSVARAAQSRRVPFSYRAPAFCPSAESFAGLVAAHTSALELVREEPERAEIAVTIAGPPGAPSGTLAQLANAAPAGATREIRGASCDEVADALAITVAIGLDPELAQTGAAEVTPKVAVRAQALPPRDPNAARWTLGAGLGATALFDTGVLPTAALAFERRAPWPGRAGVARPELRLEIAHGRNDGPFGTIGAADLQTWGARIAGCPVGLASAGEALRARLCVGIDGGLAMGRGHAEVASSPTTASGLWASAVVEARIGQRLGRRWELEGHADLGRALRRVRFAYADDAGGTATPVATTSLWPWSVGLDLVVRFP